VLDAERSKIPPPSSDDDGNRLTSLAAVAGVQNAIGSATLSSVPMGGATLKPSDFTIFVQYPEGSQDTAARAQGVLTGLGYRVPGIERVNKAPSRLQVRYYRTEQKPYAEALATELGKSLELKTGADNAIRVTSAKQLPTGILELWLPQ
jgi:hypothetical protein